MEADAARVEADIAEIEAEIREERMLTVELEERVDVGLGIETRVEEEEFVEISESEIEERVQSVKEVGAPVESASQPRRRLVLRGAEAVVHRVQPEEETEEQILGASRRRRKILAEEPEEEEEEGENIIFPLQPEGPSQATPVKPYESRAELEKKKKGKQPVLPLEKKIKLAASTLRIEEPRLEEVATPATDSDEEAAWREMRERMRDTPSAPVYPVMQVTIDRHSLAKMVKFDNAQLEEECNKRVIATKQLKSGKKLHQPALERLDAQEEFT